MKFAYSFTNTLHAELQCGSVQWPRDACALSTIHHIKLGVEFSTSDVTLILKKKKSQTLEFFGLFLELFLFCFGCSTDPTITVLPEAHCPWVLRLVRTLRHHFHLILPHRGAEWETALLFPLASALVFPGPRSSSLLPPTTSLQGPGSQASPSVCHTSLVKCLLPPFPQISSMTAPLWHQHQCGPPISLFCQEHGSSARHTVNAWAQSGDPV